MTPASEQRSSTSDRMLDEILPGGRAAEVTVTGDGSLPSVFAVTELATASVAAAGVAVSGLLASDGGVARAVTANRRLASMWFASSLRPEGWAPAAAGCGGRGLPGGRRVDPPAQRSVGATRAVLLSAASRRLSDACARMKTCSIPPRPPLSTRLS